MSCNGVAFRIPCNDDHPRMTTPDSTFEQRALHLFRNLLDMDAEARECALAGIGPALRARVDVLLARVADDDLREAPLDQRIGPYQLLERIGQGGMGEVFRARRVDGAFEKDVAIKRIWAGHAPLALVPGLAQPAAAITDPVTASTATAAETATHEVQRGDSVWSIARRYGVTRARLLELNGLHPRSVLRPGMILKTR